MRNATGANEINAGEGAPEAAAEWLEQHGCGRKKMEEVVGRVREKKVELQGERRLSNANCA